MGSEASVLGWDATGLWRSRTSWKQERTKLFTLRWAGNRDIQDGIKDDIFSESHPSITYIFLTGSTPRVSATFQNSTSSLYEPSCRAYFMINHSTRILAFIPTVYNINATCLHFLTLMNTIFVRVVDKWN